MANVQVIRVGHALIEGARGLNGGKSSKDSIWGLALLNEKQMVAFFGRRNGKLRFKTYTKKEQEFALKVFADKCAGKHKGFAYVDLSNDQAKIDELIPNLAANIGKTYYKDLGVGLVNAARRTSRLLKEQRDAAKAAEAATVEVVAQNEEVAA